jgi:copper chaperone CopZ
MEYAEYEVRGLGCELSVASVVGAMAFVPGVRAVTLDVLQDRIRITFDPAKTDASQFLRAAQATGHRLRVQRGRLPMRGAADLVQTSARCLHDVHG